MLNSGTFLGPSRLLVSYIEAMLEEFEHRWHCMRLHGSDQAVHNFLVYSGKFIGTGTYSFVVLPFSATGAAKFVGTGTYSPVVLPLSAVGAAFCGLYHGMVQFSILAREIALCWSLAI